MYKLYQNVTVQVPGYDRNEKVIPLPTPLGVIAFCYLLIVLFSVVFTVGKGEQAVKFTMGAYSSSYAPGGPYFKLPWPFESVEKVDVFHIKEAPIGYRMENGKPIDNPAESETLTGDANTVMIDSTLQYQRTDAKRWLLTSNEPERIVRLFAQAALRSAVAERTFDQILTTERTTAQTGSEKRIRDMLEQIDLGATVVAHQIQDTQPPEPVRKAFTDVTNAIEERNRKIHEGTGYSNEKLKRAKGESSKLLEDAIGYKNARINHAKGAADRFDLVYSEYRKAPDLTKERMRFETLEAVLPGKVQIVDKTGGNSSAPILKLMDVGAAAAAKTQNPKK